MGSSFHPSSYAVLVVEDDALVRAEAVDLCQEAGFKTYEARSTDQALQLLERHADIRVLFTDIEMPGTMDGLRLARAVRENWSPVSILVTSGRMKIDEDALPEDGLFFLKPYTPDEILGALNSIAKRLPPLES